MKATNSNMLSAVSLGLSFLVFGICGASCRQKEYIHPDARAAMDSLGRTNLNSLWERVAPFADNVRKESRLTRLAVDGSDVFTILAGQVNDAKVFSETLVPVSATQPLAQTDAEYILAWIKRCKTFGVCGFDIRSLPEYHRIFIRNDVCFIVLSTNTSPQCIDDFISKAKRGFTPRGDVFAQVTNGVFITTERR